MPWGVGDSIGEQFTIAVVHNLLPGELQNAAVRRPKRASVSYFRKSTGEIECAGRLIFRRRGPQICRIVCYDGGEVGPEIEASAQGAPAPHQGLFQPDAELTRTAQRADVGKFVGQDDFPAKDSSGSIGYECVGEFIVENKTRSGWRSSGT